MPEPGRFLTRSWPDGGVVFDRYTGDTHAIDSFALRVMAACEAVGPSPSAVSRYLESTQADGAPIGTESMISDVIRSLSELEIVAPPGA